MSGAVLLAFLIYKVLSGRIKGPIGSFSRPIAAEFSRKNFRFSESHRGKLVHKYNEYINLADISVNDALGFVKPQKRKLSVNAVVTSFKVHDIV